MQLVYCCCGMTQVPGTLILFLLLAGTALPITYGAQPLDIAKWKGKTVLMIGYPTTSSNPTLPP